MKKRVLLSLLLGVAGVFAAQEPKRVTVGEAMSRLERTIQNTDQPDVARQGLRAKLENRARLSADGKIDFEDAVIDLNAIRAGGPVLVPAVGRGDGQGKEGLEGDQSDLAVPEKIKRPEEDIVGQFLPNVLAEQVGPYVPLRWNLQFKPGQLVQEFNERKLAGSFNFSGVRACAHGRYLAFEQNFDIGSIKITMWDMLSMKEDKDLSYIISYERSRPVWDISPEGGVLVYQVDKKIVGVNLRSKKDDRDLFTQKTESDVDDLSFSWDGKSVLGYTRGLGAIVVWDAATGNEVPAESQALTQSISALPLKKKVIGGIADYSVLSPGGKKLAIIKNKHTIKSKTIGYKTIEIWDLATKSLRQTIQVDDERYFDNCSCVFDDGGDRLAVITNNADKSIDNADKPILEVWNLNTGIRECAEQQQKTSFLSYANRTAFSPDGLWLVTSFHEEGGFKIWSLPALQKKYELSGYRDMPPMQDVSGEGEGKEEAAGIPVMASDRPMQPTKRVTVDEFMEALYVEGVALMEEDQLDDVRKQLRELAQTSPDKKIEESLAQQIVDDTLRAAAPRELPESGYEDMPPLEDVPESEDIEEKEEAAHVPAHRLTVPQARREFKKEVNQLTGEQRELWNKELNKLAAKSLDTKVDYEDARELFNSINGQSL